MGTLHELRGDAFATSGYLTCASYAVAGGRAPTELRRNPRSPADWTETGCTSLLMTNLQPIEFEHRVVAVVIGTDHAAISDRVPQDRRQLVQRMCVYALEIASGERPGPYRDKDAERHAKAASRA